jgi:hypothetical protein
VEGGGGGGVGMSTGLTSRNSFKPQGLMQDMCEQTPAASRHITSMLQGFGHICIVCMSGGGGGDGQKWEEGVSREAVRGQYVGRLWGVVRGAGRQLLCQTFKC